jgi:hypothetical protein
MKKMMMIRRPLMTTWTEERGMTQWITPGIERVREKGRRRGVREREMRETN